MELLPSTLNIDYMKYRHLWVAFSLLLMGFCFFKWNELGIDKYGVDFAGGTDIIVKFENPLTIGELRAALGEAGFGNANVQAFEGDTHEFSIRLKTDTGADTGDRISDALESIPDNKFEVLKQDFVGPVIGEQIRQNGIKAIVVAMICLMIYISFRFEWRFAVGAVAALTHDVIVAAGLYVISGRELSASTLAALLTIMGYSLNDTIVIYDRVRENFNLAIRGEKKKKGPGPDLSRMSFTELVNLSVNQTMSRTILTGVTTLLVCAVLWQYAGGEVADMAYVLVIGVIVGTYSTVFVACAVVIALERWHSKFAEAKSSPARRSVAESP